MKIKLQTMLKRNWRTLLLLLTFITPVQSLFGETYKVKGSFNSWNEIGCNNDCYIYLDASTNYTFKIRITDYGGQDFGLNSTSYMTSSNCTNWTLKSNGSDGWSQNCGITTGNRGYYKFLHNGREGSSGSYWGYFNVSVHYPSEFKIMHGWNGGTWTWQTMTRVGTTDMYRYEGKYSGGKNLKLGFDDGNCYERNADNVVGSPSKGTDCIFLVNTNGVGKTPADATITIGTKAYSIIGAFNSWASWNSMTAVGDGTYYYDCTSVGEFKLSDMAAYDKYFYTGLSTATCTGATLSGSFSTDNNCTVSTTSGYTTPVRIYLNPSTKKVWAVATVACTSASINTNVSQTAWETCGTGGSPTQLIFVANGTEPSYQWHKSTTSDFEPSEGTEIDGAIYSTYTPSYPGNPGPVYYKCVATVSCNSTSVTSRQSGGYQWKVVPSVGTISSSNNTPCTGTNFTLTYAPQTTGTYQWKYKSGSTWDTGGTGTTYETSQTGTVQYKVIVTAANGCTAESTGDKIKTIVATPNAELSNVTFNKSSICFGGTSTATANGAVLGGGTGAWSKSGTSVESITNTSASSTVKTSAITASSSVSGNTTITYTITGGCGTSPLSESAIITVNPDASLEDATISSSPTAMCSGANATASITDAVLGGGTAAWSIDGTGVSINSESGAITTTSASAGTMPVIAYTITGGCGTGGEPISLSASPLTINGVSINRTPSTVHGYEVTTLSASPAKDVTWHIQSKPGSITTNQAYFVKDDGKATASDVSSKSIIFKGMGTSDGGNSYTVRATDGSCTTDETFSVINDTADDCD